MKIQNPFPYSDDNKRYHTWNYYLQHRYHQKICKVALNAGLSCPNRDGTCGWGGCTFCGTLGSGDCAGDVQEDLMTQFAKGFATQRRKWPNSRAIAYFQAYTNTYCALSVLQNMLDPFMQKDDIPAIALATRADCLEKEKIDYLQTLTQKKDVWLEIGLQSIHNDTAQRIGRGHSYETFLDCIERLKDTDIHICVHLINSLPYETAQQMILSAEEIGKLPIHAVKIHMLQLMEQTHMAQEYEQHPFPILTKEEYIDIVIRQLEVLPGEIVIQRLTGDGVQDKLLAPEWTKKKVIVLNDIDKEMVKRNTWQGKRLHNGS